MKKLPFPNVRMWVTCHRGDSYNHKENTLPAFAAALASGADMMETDVRLSADGVLVLMHDEAVDRTTDGTGLVKEMTFAQLRALNAGEKLEPAVIPTLEELLELLAPTGMLLNLEVKEYWYEGNEARCHACIDACAALVEKYGMADRMVFNSFDAHVLEYVEEKWPGRYRLHGFYPYDIMANVVKNPDDYLYCACIFDDRTPAHYDYLRQRGIEPWIGAGVLRSAHLRECAENGAVMVCSNYPADTVEKLKALGLR